MPLIVRSLSTWLKVALVVLSLGVLLFVIGFATESWMVAGGGYHSSSWNAHGLWKYKACRVHSCGSGKYNTATLPDFHKATQALECIGLIAVFLALLLLLLYCFVDSCRRREALTATIFFIFGAVLCMVIGIIVFATKYEEIGYEIGWSMGVAIAGVICTFIAGVFCVLQLCAR